ncbi:MAG: hypothetical protein LUF68_09735, partial [Clostridiales bacterium]|nr:hypothetical protein [Clostridiales bacterium]
VLARKRQQASTEFEMNCARLVKYTVQRTDSIPNRYKKFVRPCLLTLVNAAYYDAIMANEADSRTPAGKRERVKLLDDGIRALARLEKPLVAYWSLFKTSEGGMKEWTTLINKEMVLLNGAAGYKPGERELPMIHTFDMAYNPDREFVNKMRELHKFTYDKICHVPLDYKDHLSDQILTFVDNALYNVLMGNLYIPVTMEQYEIRDGRFKKAIQNLNGLQRPLYALWNVMEYSEATMDEWAELINEELKLIQGVRKSDRQRFGHLPREKPAPRKPKPK